MFHGFPVSYVLIPAGLLWGAFLGEKREKQVKTSLEILVFVYIGVILMSVLLSYGKHHDPVGEMVMWVQRGLVFTMVLLNVKDEKALARGIAFFLIVVTVLGVQAVQQGVTGVGWAGVTPHPGYDVVRVRWVGDWDGPNVYGLILATAGSMLLEFAWSRKNSIQRVLAVLGFIVALAGIYYTNSRGSVLAMCSGILFVGIFRFAKNAKVLTRAIIIIVLGLIIISQFMPGRMKELSSSDSSAHERTWMWERGLRMLRANPLLGVGKGIFAPKTGLRAHNNYVQVFAETGLVGFFIWMGILYFAFKPVSCYTLRSADSELDVQSRMLLVGLGVYCIATFFITLENDSLFLLLGFMACAQRLMIAKGRCLGLDGFGKKDARIILLSMVLVLVAIWLIAINEII